jgi:hypothetical protein
MKCRGNQRNHAAQHCVPVENAGIRSGTPVRPERKKKVTVFARRNATDYVGQSRSIKHSQKQAGEKKQTIEKRALHADSHLHTEFDAHAAHNQQPQNDHQRQIASAERRCIEQRKAKLKSASAGEQPHLIAVPYRSNRAQHDLFVLFAARKKRLQNTDAEIKSVEHHVGDDHDRNDPEPNESHHVHYSYKF